jgi:Leucine Rich repeat
MTAHGLRRIMDGPFSSRLERLVVNATPIYQRGHQLPTALTPWAGEVIAGSPIPGRLTGLLLDGAGIGNAGGMALTRSGHLSGVRQLGLRYNTITGEGVESLAGGAAARGLKYLGLGGNAIGPRGAEALAASPHLRPQHLCLFAAELGDQGVRALTRWPGLKAARYLDLSYNGIAAAGVTALLESPYLDRVRYLVLRGNEVAWQMQVELRERFGDRVAP